MSATYDLIIIGSGPGGYVAAIRASQLGMKTALIEREHLGGICLNWGCIPTKALLRSAELLDQVSRASEFGISTGKIHFDLPAIVDRSRKVSRKLNSGVGYLLKKNKVDVIWGEAAITKPGELRVTRPKNPARQPQHPTPSGTLGKGTYKTKHIVVATGARPRVIPGIEPDEDRIWTYFDAMIPTTAPKSLIVMGSGAIGLEFASFYNSLGTDVTVVEMEQQIMPSEDAEIAAAARKKFEQHGIKFRTKCRIKKVTTSDEGVTAWLEETTKNPRKIAAEKLISAVGVQGNIENIGLEALGVEFDRGYILTDGIGRTNVTGIYAIGDVAGPPMLAHKAVHEGVICAETIAGLDTRPIDKSKIPGCIYSHPQIASVGLSEQAARIAGHNIRVGRFPFSSNGKAIALGEPDGLVKTIFDADSCQLLGAHMVGAEVTELIQGFVVAMNLETTEEHLMQTIFPHPTLSETMAESVLSAFDRAVH